MPATPPLPANPHADLQTNPRAWLAQLFRHAVHSALPGTGLEAYLPNPPAGRTLVLGAGKAAAGMAQALERVWPADKPLSGMVITRYGHTGHDADGPGCQRVEVVQAAHPVPDAAGQAAAQRMLALTEGLTADDLVIFLISGGASALLSLPCPGLSLADKQRITEELLRSGAAIGEINCVRRHLSAIKGGRLALACQPAQVLTLAISDVPGDDLAAIGSGPTVADPSTCADALAVLARYNISVPEPVRESLLSGTLETVKPTVLTPGRHTAFLMGTPQKALQAAARWARAAGLPVHVLGDRFEGEASEMAKFHAALAHSIAEQGMPCPRPCLLLSGGEASVTLARHGDAQPSAGGGGRASEFCLSLALALQGRAHVWGLAADTDGIDGSEDHAGAFVTPDTLARAQAQGLRPLDMLQAHNSYAFFQQLDDLLITGPTGTNVNDFRALLIL